MKQPAHPYKDFRGYPVPMEISPFPSDPDIMNIGPKLKKQVTPPYQNFREVPVLKEVYHYPRGQK